MALTIRRKHVGTIGNLLLSIVDVTFDNAYPTGGEPLEPGSLGLTNPFAVTVGGTGGEVAVYDSVNRKLKLFTGDGVEAVSLSDQSGVTVTVVAFGN